MSKLFELERAAEKPMKLSKKKSAYTSNTARPRFRFRIDVKTSQPTALPELAINVSDLAWSFCSTECFVAHEGLNRFGLITADQSFSGETAFRRVATAWNYRLELAELYSVKINSYVRHQEEDDNEPLLDLTETGTRSEPVSTDAMR